jgi:ppGpp synthetase/RelA/SpoT-type nucleotidyltranferase
MSRRVSVEPEDSLRAEYFDLLPDVSRLAEQLRTEIQFHTLSISRRLKRHEQLLVTSRVKECGSAIDKLRRKQESGDFDRSAPEQYSLTSLNDLAAVRVLVFPRRLMEEVEEMLRRRFSSWKAGHTRNEETIFSPISILAYAQRSARGFGANIRLFRR